MNLENIVADLEYCKDLDPKVWGETVFVYAPSKVPNCPHIYIMRRDYELLPETTDNPISAPTFAEVWANLPVHIVRSETIYDLKFNKYRLVSSIMYSHGEENQLYSLNCTSEKKPANAAIKLFKWCEENGYL